MLGLAHSGSPSDPSRSSGLIASRSPATRRSGRHEAAVSVRCHLLHGRATGRGAGVGGTQVLSLPSLPRPTPPPDYSGLDTPTPKPRRVSRERAEMEGAFEETDGDFEDR